MKKLFCLSLACLMFASISKAQEKTPISWQMKLAPDSQSVELKLKNKSGVDLICDNVVVSFGVKNAEIGEIVVRSKDSLDGIQYFKPHEEKNIVVGKENLEGLSGTDREYAFLPEYKVETIECYQPGFLDYLKYNKITAEEKKLLDLLHRVYNVMNIEEVEATLNKSKDLTIMPHKNTLKNPDKMRKLSAPMSLALLRFFPHLETISLSSVGVTNLSGLENLKALKSLNLQGNKGLKDLTPIAKNFALATIDISDTNVDSLEAVRGLSHLKSINIKNTPITDLGWLMQPNELECVVFDNLKVKTENKATQELLKKSKQTFEECSGDEFKSGTRWFY